MRRLREGKGEGAGITVSSSSERLPPKASMEAQLPKLLVGINVINL